MHFSSHGYDNIFFLSFDYPQVTSGLITQKIADADVTVT